MANKTPLKFAYDNTTPSALAEFVASDTVSVGNGGTGVSSLDLLGNSLSGTGISASSVSATHVSAVSLSSTNISSYHVSASHVSAVSLSSTSITVVDAMPYPAPFGYMQLEADDVASVDEKKLGYSNTPGTIVSDGITWDDTNKYFVAAAAGTYEVMAVVILEGGSTLVNLSIQKNGSDVLVGQPRVHSTVDPLEHTMRAVFTMTAGQNANVTYDATASNSVKAITGSTMTIKRLK
jgi:hypothetical protein